MFRFRKIHAFQAEHGSFFSFFIRIIREHIEREHHIFKNRHAVEQGRPLEQHAHFPAKHVQFQFIHGGKVAPVIQDLTRIRFHQADDIFDQDRFSGTASSDDQIGLPCFKNGADIIQHCTAFK